jgi:23S rRNA (cytosine1962-C5)-methyltransferase
VTTAPTRLRLAKELERSLRAGHPWVYADALASPPAGLATGSVVDVTTRDGRFVGRGLYDGGSPIAVRVATLDASEALDAAFVRRRLASALAVRESGAIDRATTDCFRWVNGEGDRLPGVVVDVYGPVAVVRFDGEAARVWRDAVVEGLVSLGAPLGLRHVYERSRGARGEVLHGGEPPRPVVVREHGAIFRVDVHAGQKTGFFLDQRDNRALLGRWARGRTVANLFGYTGGFSVQCARGGASRVVTVDVARQALADARENFAANGLDPAAHEFDCVDAFAWLDAAAAAGRTFDLVIVDPPSFAPSEKALKRALVAYRDLNASALRVVAPGGLFASASCSSHVAMEHFLEVLRDAAAVAGRPLRLLEVRGQPPDHPSLPAFPEGRYLKFVLAGCFS